jgi:glucose-6-phosphate dehydrogenase assembly protein OpcA
VATRLTTPGVWGARNTTPAQIEAALLRLMHESAAGSAVRAPARVLNLVVVADRESKDEIAGRLDRINRDNPARTILVVVEPGKQGLDATASLVHDEPDQTGGNTVFRERVEVECGSDQLVHLDTIVRPILASEVGTVVWSPHGHPEAVNALRGLAASVLVDSFESSDWRTAIARIAELSEHVEVTDLAWLRSTPWRERVAAAFDPPLWRSELDAIDRVEVRMHPGSTMSALLLLGWLASRLEWQPSLLELDAPGAKRGDAGGPAGRIELSIESDRTMPVPGISGLSVATANGLTLSLNRAAGGLRAERVLPDGGTHEWTVLGASRGEDGILAHGLTHALFPDDLFRPAFDAACAFGGRSSIARANGGESSA